MLCESEERSHLPLASELNQMPALEQPKSVKMPKVLTNVRVTHLWVLEYPLPPISDLEEDGSDVKISEQQRTSCKLLPSGTCFFLSDSKGQGYLMKERE